MHWPRWAETCRIHNISLLASWLKNRWLTFNPPYAVVHKVAAKQQQQPHHAAQRHEVGRLRRRTSPADALAAHHSPRLTSAILSIRLLGISARIVTFTETGCDKYTRYLGPNMSWKIINWLLFVRTLLSANRKHKDLFFFPFYLLMKYSFIKDFIFPSWARLWAKSCCHENNIKAFQLF